MSREFRCVVFAAVSSKPQAADEKDSIPTQIARARELIEHRGWEEVHEPLVVPGHTRSISWLHEARDEVPAIDGLVRLARRREIDLVICRGYDRLARRRALLAQLSEYLSQRRVQIYALDKPVEPVDPDRLGRRGSASQSAAIIEALSGVQDEEEVNRLTNRREFGMNAVMRRGVRKLPERMIPFGYTRVVEDDRGEEARVDVPQVVEGEKALVGQIEDLYLSGYSYRRVAALLNAEGIPSPRGSKWQTNTVRNILRNEFYCGLVVWGYRRRERVYDPEEGDFVKRNVRAPIVEELYELTGYLPTAFDLMDYPEECERDGVVVCEGEHEPIRSRERQRELYDEMGRRRGMGGRAAAAGERCHLFGGIATCDCCGYAMTARPQTRGGKTYVYYGCRGRRTGVDCPNKRYIREGALYDAVMGTLLEISRSPEAVDEYLAGRASERLSALAEERDRLRDALAGLARRRARWDEAYETGVIGLSEYGDRVGLVEEERREARHRLERVQGRLADAEREERRREDIMQLLEEPPAVEDRQATKVFLRRVVEDVRIRDGEVVKLVL